LKNGSTVDIELKPGTERYEIYTGIGQLLLNQDQENPAFLVLVTPKDIRDSTPLISRLSDFDIRHVGYERSGRKFRFEGLSAALAGVRKPARPV
jgi:hypothetical protein